MDNVEAGSSSPPIVVGDVVVGPAGGIGARPNAKTQVKLDVRGFDVRTGKLLWTFHTIPASGEFGYDTWLTPGSAEYTGNGGVWGPTALAARSCCRTSAAERFGKAVPGIPRRACSTSHRRRICRCLR